jgi:hemoglobin
MIRSGKVLLAVVALALMACTTTDHEMASRAARPPLYDRLGGTPAITAVVDDFIANVAADPRLSPRFAGVDVPRLKGLLVDQICQATGGPCTYRGRSMLDAHRGMQITDAEFGALVEDLVKSLDRFKVPAPEKTELLTALAALKPQIVGQ